MAAGLGYFETRLETEAWNTRDRFIFISQRSDGKTNHPSNSTCLKPIEYDEFKVIVTNRKIKPRKVVLFHEGRGSQ